MTALQLLTRCRLIEKDRETSKSKIARYRDSATRATSAMDGVGVRSTSEPDKMAAIMGEIDALEHEAQQREREYAAEVVAACRLLDALPEIEGRVMNAYYVKGQSLNEVARDMSYSYGYIRGIKSSATARLGATPQRSVITLLPKWYMDNLPEWYSQHPHA